MKFLKIVNIFMLLLAFFGGYILTQLYRNVEMYVGVVKTSKEWEQIEAHVYILFFLIAFILLGLVIQFIIMRRISKNK